jgi:hypothetical protein
VSAELAARRTMAAALAADFRGACMAYEASGPEPQWSIWAFRLSVDLESVLEQLERETADPAAGQLAQIRLVLDHFDWETDDRQYALEQIDDILRSAP